MKEIFNLVDTSGEGKLDWRELGRALNGKLFMVATMSTVELDTSVRHA